MPGCDTVVTSFSPSTGALSTFFSSKSRLSSATNFTSAGIVSFVTFVVFAMSSIVPAGLVVFVVVVGFVNSPVFGSTS